MHVMMDVSRLLMCGRKQTPSGIDRVELAYARHWLAAPASACSFVAQDLRGGFALLPRKLVEALVSELCQAWDGGDHHGEAAQRANRLGLQARGRLLLGFGRQAMGRLLRSGQRIVFLLVSHRALERQGPIAAIRASGAAFVPLIHDIIPVTHPEYARPGQAETHQRRMATTGALADGIITNSSATALALEPYLAHRRQRPPIVVAPLGIERVPFQPRPTPSYMGPGAAFAHPSFVTLGTIEPRKNHLLLLHLWRSLAAIMGPDAPRLTIVGKRGWENENVVDILERCTALNGVVQEAGQLPDRQVAGLLRNARALLFPSFAEGYGLPLAEALALGVPVICSDLPALREVGGDVPDYLDPVDGAAWRDAVLDYIRPDSPRRAAQLARMARWKAPSWEDHFVRVDAMLEEVAHSTVQRQGAAASRPRTAQAAPRPRPAAVPPLVAVRDKLVS
jgi:glycosyltransferase involved in cell wall biosynthesis